MDIDFLNSNIKKGNIDNILNMIKNKNDINIFNNIIIENINKISEINLKFYIKILLNRIIYLKGDVNTLDTKKIYVILKKKKLKVLDTVNKFIFYFDKLNKTQKLYFGLTEMFINIFKDYDKKFNAFVKKDNLTKIDLYYISKKIEERFYKLFLSYFDSNNPKLYLSKLYLFKKYKSKNILINNLVERMIGLVKLFKIKNLKNLNIEIISIEEYYNYQFKKQIEYFSNLFIQINSLFKIYKTYNSRLEILEFKLSNLIKINLLDNFTEIIDSSSDEEEQNNSVFIKNNVENIEDSINYDTPIVKNVIKESSSSDSESYGTDYEDEEIIKDIVDEVINKVMNLVHD